MDSKLLEATAYIESSNCTGLESVEKEFLRKDIGTKKFDCETIICILMRRSQYCFVERPRSDISAVYT